MLISMIKKAFADLTPFLIFFMIVLVLFTFIMGVLGFQNYNVPAVLNKDTYSVQELVANQPFISAQ